MSVTYCIKITLLIVMQLVLKYIYEQYGKLCCPKQVMKQPFLTEYCNKCVSFVDPPLCQLSFSR